MENETINNNIENTLGDPGFEGLENSKVKTMVLIPNDDKPLKSLTQYNFMNFLNFLQYNKVFPMAIASILSDRINELANTFVNGIIMPLINRDCDKDGVRDIKQLEDRYITLFNAKFMIGKLLVSILKFVIISYIVFIMTKIANKIYKKLEKQT